MKKYYLLVTIPLLICSQMIFAQSKNEKAVAVAVEQLTKAMTDADKTALENLADDQLSYGHSSGHIDDKKAFVDKIVSGKSDFVSIDLAEQTITISGKVAIVRHILNAKTNDGGKPGEVHLKVMLVWQKQGGQWKLLARQAVKIS
jgi:ketosteroid isomerase-like protein